MKKCNIIFNLCYLESNKTISERSEHEIINFSSFAKYVSALFDEIEVQSWMLIFIEWL